jgi:membrane-associated phospholipid phosphatase
LYYSIKNRFKWANLFFVVVMLGIWFTAVYASHHYILDVLAGILSAITGIIIFNVLITRVNFFRVFIEKYEKTIR